MKMEQKEPDKISSLDKVILHNGNSNIVLASKDGLVGELEKTIFEMENQLAQAMKYEEEKQNIEFERGALMKEVEKSLSDIQILVCHSKELEEQNHSMEEENSSLKMEVEQLKQQAKNKVDNNLNKNGEQLCEQGTSAEHRYSGVDNKQKNCVIKLNGHERKSIDLNSTELEKLRFENQELQKLLDLSEEAEDEAMNELSKVKKDLLSCEHVIENLEKEKEILAFEKEKVSANYRGLLKELDRVKMELLDLMDAKKSSAEEENKEQANKLKETVKILEQEKKKSIEQMENVRAENLRLQEKIVQLQVALASSQQQQERFEQLEEEVKELKLIKDKYENESAELVQKGVKATQLLKNSLEKLTTEKKDLQRKIEIMEKEMADDKECLKNERCEYAKMKAELEKLKKQIESVGNDSVVEQRQGEKFFPDITGLNLKMKSELSGTNYDGYSVKELQEECERLFKKNQALTGVMGKLENENKDLDVENEELESQNHVLKERIDELEKGKAQVLGKLATEKAELVNKVDVFANENASLKKNFDDSQHKNTELQSKLETEKEDKERWKRKFEEVLKKSEENLNIEKLKLIEKDDEIKLLKWRFQKENLEIKETVNKDKEERDNMIKQRDDALEKVKNIEKEQACMIIERKTLLEEIETLKISVEKDKDELLVAKDKIEKLEKQIQISELKTKESETANTELRKSYAVANDLAMEKSLELSRTRRMLERKLEKLFKENIEMKKRMREFVPTSKPPSGKSKTDGSSDKVASSNLNPNAEPDVIQAVVTSVYDGVGEKVMEDASVGQKTEDKRGQTPVKVVISESQTLPRLRTNKSEEWKRSSLDSKRVLSGEKLENLETARSQTLPRQRSSHHSDEEKIKRHTMDTNKLLSLVGDYTEKDHRYHTEADFLRSEGERMMTGKDRRPKSTTDLSDYRESRSESGFSVVGYRKRAVKMEEHWV